MRLRLLALICCLGTAAVSPQGPSDAHGQASDKDAAAMLAVLLAADDPEELAWSYHELFMKASEEQLRGLLSHTNDGVALAAGWERVRRTIPEGDELADVKPERTALSRFLGLVEGRLHMPLPPIWEAALQSTSSNGRANIWFGDPDEIGAKVVVHGDATENDRRADFRCEDHQCRVTVGDKTWLLPSEDLVETMFVELSRTTAFVALYCWPPASYTLYAIDRESGKAFWTSKVWAHGDLCMWTGRGWHHVELRTRGNAVVVFGVEGSVAYVEEFDAGTGKNLCRFATSYFEFTGE